MNNKKVQCRTFQIEVWNILKWLDGKGLAVKDVKLINKNLEEFNKLQDNGTKLSFQKQDEEKLEEYFND